MWLYSIVDVNNECAFTHHQCETINKSMLTIRDYVNVNFDYATTSHNMAVAIYDMCQNELEIICSVHDYVFARFTIIFKDSFKYLCTIKYSKTTNDQLTLDQIAF